MSIRSLPYTKLIKLIKDKVNWVFNQTFFFRIEALEQELKETIKALEQEKKNFSQLKEDFKYNLKLLEERDKELNNIENYYSGID